jgi:hypothetical protein
VRNLDLERSIGEMKKSDEHVRTFDHVHHGISHLAVVKVHLKSPTCVE